MRYKCFQCDGAGKRVTWPMTGTGGRQESLCDSCRGAGVFDLATAVSRLGIVENSFEPVFNDEPLSKRAFTTLDIPQLIAAIDGGSVQPDRLEFARNSLYLLCSRGGPSLRIFRVARDFYALMLVTSSSTYDEGGDWMKKKPTA